MVILSHFPVLHQGYLKIINKYPEAKINIITPELIKELVSHKEDIRQVPIDLLEKFFKNLEKEVVFLDKENLKDLNKQELLIIIQEPLTLNLAKKLELDNQKIVWESPLLRHKQEDVFTAKTVDLETAEKNYTEQDVNFMKQAFEEAQKSGCWWRQVGSILVKDGQVLFKAHNTILPHEDECHLNGCIRDHIKPGEKMQYCSALHSEVAVIAQAAKEGVSLEGTSLYVLNFPCSNCAKAIAHSGIKKVYFIHGWSNFDGEQVLRSKNIELIKMNFGE